MAERMREGESSCKRAAGPAAARLDREERAPRQGPRGTIRMRRLPTRCGGVRAGQ
jgi:hypothetical protein